ncbi:MULTISPECIES: AbgT family transporter [Aeromonas]|uniref:AbgT family transporter n=1 Tax=Aeromonas taiwanensis TaxID=633417 RepID=A0A5F0KDX2_9GAMM|nr:MULTISPECIES: AbgT family transporter [Aeromonas]MBP4042654.1 AbgT family transporter [Aeromonas sp. SrichE-2G]MCO4204662.1 AbgT family transporter [Aeromonas taiwanensis]TFF78884.1 AbgT family transporter [Aeromonas taiwanensis]TFF79354.1 AbgT family transporter [Aeromonas taiwanensis]TFF82636.1 AbgT family transporter [Aeromonas taiwanensis]
MSQAAVNERPANAGGWLNRFLNGVEKAGNKLPDPAMLFLYALLIVWVGSWIGSQFTFDLVNPRTGEAVVVNNLLTGAGLAEFLSSMVTTFTGFAPLGIVLVAMLGVGVAEQSGFINTGLKKLLKVTPARFLTPMLILVAIVSHTAADAGYVLVIPIGGIIFHAAGRHPLAGIAAAFAGVSGGFAANFLPSGGDALLQGFTQSAAQLLDPDYMVNTLCNIIFTGASSLLIICVGWFVTERIVEPRLKQVPLNEDLESADEMGRYSERESRAFNWAGFAMLAAVVLLGLALSPGDSPLRAPDGSLTTFAAPVMKSIVPLIFLLFILPGIVYGFVAGSFKSGKDVIDAMSATMNKMGSYMVMAFFCALFIKAFGDSNLGTLLALSGAEVLHALALPGEVTIVGMILLTATVNLVVGSASAKWALISPILVPMLMAVGISPELTQAAYRVGDSASNIITPLMVFFPLVVVYCQQYVKSTGIGTLVSMMLPYSLAFLVSWTIFLLVYWGLGFPLGLQAPYVYPAP